MIDKDRYIFENAIKECFRFFGSKSGFRATNPDAEPIFNAHVVYQKDGDFYRIQGWANDIDLMNKESMNQLFNIALKEKIDIYIYRESTNTNEIDQLSLFVCKIKQNNNQIHLSFKDSFRQDSDIFMNYYETHYNMFTHTYELPDEVVKKIYSIVDIP